MYYIRGIIFTEISTGRAKVGVLKKAVKRIIRRQIGLDHHSKS